MTRFPTMLALVLTACGSSSAPSSGSGSAVPTETTADIDKLGTAWRAKREDAATLVKLVELARSSNNWKPAVPYLAESLALTDAAIDGAFDAVVALGASDPKVTIALTTPIEHAVWTGPDVKIPYARVAQAEARVDRALIPAYLALAKLPDSADNRAARGHALARLARWNVKEARSLWFDALGRPPFLERASGGTMVDPRGFYHLYGIEGLEGLGFDDEAAAALLAYANSTDDTKTDPVIRNDALEALSRVMRHPSAEQRTILLHRAIDPKQFENAQQCGRMFALLAATAEEVDQLKQAPPDNPPYFFSYGEQITAVHRVLACAGARPCLIALLETQNDRQHDSFLIERVVRDLSTQPADDVVPTLLATLDEEGALADSTSKDHVESTFHHIDRLVTGPCPACIAHVEAAIASHKRDSWWNQVDAGPLLATLRGRGGKAVVMAPVREAFTAPIASEHVGFSTQRWDPEIFANPAFAIGRDANEVGTTPLAFVQRDAAALGKYQGNITTTRGVHGHVMWDAGIPLFDHGENITQLVVEDHGVYRTRAIMIADQIDDHDAARSPPPAPIADNHGDAELEQVARSVLASRTRFVASLSMRDDAISFGSSIQDRWPAGATKDAFTKLGGEFKLHDGVHVERVADDAGFAMANVDFLRRTYRVFVVFVKDNGAWTIPMSHWSLAALPAQH